MIRIGNETIVVLRVRRLTGRSFAARWSDPAWRSAATPVNGLAGDRGQVVRYTRWLLQVPRHRQRRHPVSTSPGMPDSTRSTSRWTRFSSTTSSTAIPSDMRAQGSHHIGDIDFYDGLLYAPIEGMPTSEYPTIVMYDPDTLQPTGQRFRPGLRTCCRPASPGSRSIAARQVAYTSKWLNTGILNVHRLSDFAITSTVQLSRNRPADPGCRRCTRESFTPPVTTGRKSRSKRSIPETGKVTNLFNRNLGDERRSRRHHFRHQRQRHHDADRRHRPVRQWTGSTSTATGSAAT